MSKVWKKIKVLLTAQPSPMNLTLHNCLYLNSILKEWANKGTRYVGINTNMRNSVPCWVKDGHVQFFLILIRTKETHYGSLSYFGIKKEIKIWMRAPFSFHPWWQFIPPVCWYELSANALECVFVYIRYLFWQNIFLEDSVDVFYGTKSLKSIDYSKNN